MKEKTHILTKIMGILLFFLASKIHSNERPEDAEKIMNRHIHRSQDLYNSEIFSGEKFGANDVIEFLMSRYHLEKKFKVNLDALAAYCKGFFSQLEISSPETDERLSHLLPTTYGRLPKTNGTINTFEEPQKALHYFKETLRFTHALNGNFSICDTITWLKNSLKSGVPFYCFFNIIDDLGNELYNNLQDTKKDFKNSNSEKIFMPKHREIISNFIQALKECLPQTEDESESFINFESKYPSSKKISFEKEKLYKFQNYKKNLISFNESVHIYLSFLFKEISFHHPLKKLKSNLIDLDPLSEKNFKDIAQYQCPEKSLRDLIECFKKIITYRNDMLDVDNSQYLYPFTFLTELEGKLTDKNHLIKLKNLKDLPLKVFEKPKSHICAQDTVIEKSANGTKIAEKEMPLLVNPHPLPETYVHETAVKIPSNIIETAEVHSPILSQAKLENKENNEVSLFILPKPSKKLPLILPPDQPPLPLTEKEKIELYRLRLADLLVRLRKETSMIFEEFFNELKDLQFRVCKKKGNGSAWSIYPTSDNILYPPKKFIVIHGPAGKIKRSTPIPWGYIDFIYSGFKVVFRMSIEEASELVKNAHKD